MRVLVLYEYPPPPAGLATQGHLLYQGLLGIGVDAFPVNLSSPEEKASYYRWFKPDIVVGVGFKGHAPDLVLHPLQYGVQPVPWLVADGYVANYREVLADLPLVLVTSNWVKDVYIRDGVRGDNIAALGVPADELMILMVGGDAASKGAREIMHALLAVRGKVPPYKYVCRVWPQQRTQLQNAADRELAIELGIHQNVIYHMSTTSRNFIPYLMAACDIYAAPARLEGFGMPQVEAGACEKPVLGMQAMGMLDTLVHGETALLASVAQEIIATEQIRGTEAGFEDDHRTLIDSPRTVDYRASVPDLARHLSDLMNDSALRDKLGKAARTWVIRYFDYRVVARQPDGLAIPGRPYYALWSYKIFGSQRSDLLGNSLAMLSGVASPARSARMIAWIESACLRMQARGELALALPPNFFPFILPQDRDWMPRYSRFIRPGDYHNGGIWPFTCAFYAAALIASRRFKLAEEKLWELTELEIPARRKGLSFGFNEWFKAQTGQPMGQDWQLWSASMYLYATRCVQQRRTLFFDGV